MKDRSRAHHHSIGTAGWNVPKEFASHFPTEGSHLQRYSQRLTGVEINSSFYRPHQAKTYDRWATETHENLRFAVKMTREFTHDRKLDIEEDDIARWLEPVSHLGDKLAALLVQIPPKLAFDLETANGFFKALRRQTDRLLIAFEPRHLSWTESEALELLNFYDITKVEADPERCPTPPDPTKSRYVRLHGTPEIYKSLYSPDVIEKWAAELRQTAQPSWVIFDNTTFGYATLNALQLLDLVRDQVASDDSASSSSRKLRRRKRGATTYMVPTVSKLITAPKIAD